LFNNTYKLPTCGSCGSLCNAPYTRALVLNSDDLHMQTEVGGIVKYIVIVVVALLIGIFFGINDEAFSLKGMAASSIIGGIAAVAILYIFSLKKGRDRTR